MRKILLALLLGVFTLSLAAQGIKFEENHDLYAALAKAKAENKLVFIDAYAEWCGPCKVMHPILEELSKEYSGKVDIYQIDVDKEQELAAAFGIRSIPTLLMIPMKEEPRIMQGAMPKDQLKKAIDEFLLKQNNEAKQ